MTVAQSGRGSSGFLDPTGFPVTRNQKETVTAVGSGTPSVSTRLWQMRLVDPLPEPACQWTRWPWTKQGDEPLDPSPCLPTWDVGHPRMPRPCVGWMPSAEEQYEPVRASLSNSWTFTVGGSMRFCVQDVQLSRPEIFGNFPQFFHSFLGIFTGFSWLLPGGLVGANLGTSGPRRSRNLEFPTD